MDNCQTDLRKRYPSIERSLVDSAFDYLKKFMSVHGGDTLSLQSAWGYGLFQEIAGDTTINGGYRALLERMSDVIGHRRILLGKEVVRIDYTGHPIEITIKDSNRKYQARRVIVTFSNGVLKHALANQVFKPELPSDKRRAIEAIGIGRVAKIYLEYDRPFWQPGHLKFLKFFPDVSGGTYNSEDTTRQTWAQGLNGFEEVPSSSNVLLGWLCGEDAKKIEAVSEQNVLDECTSLLRRYTGDRALPRPKRALVTSWVGDRFTRGTYSYPSMTTRDGNDFRIIGETIQNRVYFAGEGTHPTFYSTVHGARLSGLEAAAAIAQELSETHP